MAIKFCRIFLLNKRLAANRLKLRHEVNDNIIVKVQSYFMKQQVMDVSGLSDRFHRYHHNKIHNFTYSLHTYILVVRASLQILIIISTIAFKWRSFPIFRKIKSILISCASQYAFHIILFNEFLHVSKSNHTADLNILLFSFIFLDIET